MRTTIDIDPKLLERVVEVTGEKSRSKALAKVVEDYLRRKAIEELRAMAGKIDLVDNLKELEEAELKEMEQMQW